MSEIARVLALIEQTNAEQQELSVREAYAAFMRGDYESCAEALEAYAHDTTPPTLADVDAYTQRCAETARRIRSFVAAHGHKWEPHVRARHLVNAESLEDRVARLQHELMQRTG